MDYGSDKERETHHHQHRFSYDQQQQQQQQQVASAVRGTHHFIKSSSASASYKFRESENYDAVMRSEEHHQRQHHSSTNSYYNASSTDQSLQTLEAALIPEQVEKEHMFDKVVTPSDVGKLNRLVIPKQHAERHFPLDSSPNEKGLLLNFEDRTRKLWRFRYSYWNSSQSYVMTKGWSRFVKEKKLDAGDIVSFQRGVGEGFRDRLFIDWTRRPSNPLMFHHQHQPSLIIPSLSLLPHQYFPFHQSARSAPWVTSTATPLYLRPLAQLTSGHLHFPQHNYNNNFHSHTHLHNQYQQLHQSVTSSGSFQYCCNPYNNNNGVISHPYGSNSVEGSSLQTALYLGSSADGSPRGDGGNNLFPAVVHPKADQGKMLRLFGVNMECDTHEANSLHESENLASPTAPATESPPHESPRNHDDT